MKDDLERPQTSGEQLSTLLVLVVFCIPFIVTVWAINSIGMSMGLSIWFSLPISVIVTALAMAFSIITQGNSLMEVMIAMFIVMVLALVLAPTARRERENAIKKRENAELQMKRQRTPASSPIPSNTR